jgi:UDP-2-acetamido-2,6-beta-L-arabino-hexul-4-ose reductase
MKILITGAGGFVGRNLAAVLRRRNDIELFEFDIDTPKEQLLDALDRADTIVHLAGVNRPPTPAEYETGNAGFTREICDYLRSHGRAPKIMLASSIQAELDNPYGASKRRAEEILRGYSDATGAPVVVFRWTNLFGKWCRPNYNSVTATFCYNTAHGIPLQISDPNREIELAYIDDVVGGILAEILKGHDGERFTFAGVEPTYRVTLGRLAADIQSFRDGRVNLMLPDMAERFTRCLYATYLSYLPENEFAYSLKINADNRGELAEFVRTSHSGQIFVSRTKPGITRGNHYHHTKTEKFLVVEGDAVIRFRRIDTGEVLSYNVSGREFRVLDIPPGYTHSIENVGIGEMVVLFWASEVFQPAAPDTYAAEVLHG